MEKKRKNRQKKRKNRQKKGKNRQIKEKKGPKINQIPQPVYDRKQEIELQKNQKEMKN